MNLATGGVINVKFAETETAVDRFIQRESGTTECERERERNASVLRV
jgi:hypothetical protein